MEEIIINERCPICNGTGKIEGPLKIGKGLTDEKKVIVKTLIEKGYSYRQICKIMNYKSTRSISWALGKKY